MRIIITERLQKVLEELAEVQDRQKETEAHYKNLSTAACQCKTELYQLGLQRDELRPEFSVALEEAATLACETGHSA